MGIRRVLALVAALIIVVAEAFAVTDGKGTSSPSVTAPANIQAADMYGSLPLSFERNVGQAGRNVDFLSRAGGYSLLISGADLVVVPSQAHNATSATWIRLLGAIANPVLAGKELLPGKANYYIGRRENWHVGIPQYAKINGKAVYPGIDVVYYGNQRQFEYDFVVTPGAAADCIRFRVDGAELTKNAAGDVVVTGETQFTLRRPIAYQRNGQDKQMIAAEYELRGAEVSLRLGAYDHSRELIIDPVMSYSSFAGGSGYDTGNAVALDAAGNSYITGQTCSADLLNAGMYKGNCDAYVMAVKGDGSAAIYTTYLGGSNGDNGKAITADASGNVVVAGTTSSTDFPTASTPFQAKYGAGDTDAFVSRLDPAGTLLYSTFLGGSDNESGNGVALDPAGNIVVVGQTGSIDFPVVGYPADLVPFYSMFVTELDAGTGYSTAVFSRYLDPLALEAPTIDTASSVALDLLGDIFIGGTTRSAVSTTHDGNAVIAKLQGASISTPTTPGALVFGWLLMIGAEGNEPSDTLGYGIAVDSLGNSILTGKFCTLPPDVGCPETLTDWAAFVVKVNPVGSEVLFTNKFPDPSIGNAVAVDSNGFIYMAGITSTTSFPVTSPTQTILAGGQDAFLVKLNEAGLAQIFSTYYGGAASDSGNGVAVSSDGGSIYVTGTTYSLDLPTASPLQAAYAGNGDAFLAKWTGVSLPYASLKPLRINFGDQVVATTSAPQTVTLTNMGDAPLEITGINASGDFSQTHDCRIWLPVGANCTISVAFAPTTTGILTGVITIVDNAGSGTQTISLSGNGISAPVISLSPSSLNFGNQLVNTTSAGQTVRLTNTGASTLTIGSITVTGDFAQTNTCSNSLAVGSSCTISVTFTPTNTGTRSGDLTVLGNASNSPQTASLTGQGTTPSGGGGTTGDFSLSISPTSNTVTAGNAATYTLTVTPLGGFNSKLALACPEPPATITCGFSPSSVTPDGKNSTTVTVSVFTQPRAALEMGPFSSPKVFASLTTQLSFGLMGVLWVGAKRNWRRSKGYLICGLVLILVLFAVLSGCGGGNSDPPTGGSGTQVGTYTITITGSTADSTAPALSHTVTMALKVN